jgi:hypothetical protein
MSTTDAMSDPLAAALGAVLTVPVRQLYAVLWRVGVVQIVPTRRPADRLTAEFAAPAAATRRSA